MTRQTRSVSGAQPDKKEETVQVFSSGPITDVTPEFGDGRVVGDATEKNPDVPPEVAAAIPVKKMYQVTRGGMIMHNGNRTRVQAGKVLDDLNYNIRKLQEQGIGLRELQPGEDSFDPMQP